MESIQETRPRTSAQSDVTPDPFRRAKSLRPARNGTPRFHLQEHRALKNKVIEVAAGLVFRGGKVLITQRRPDDHLGGLWEFPGGKREPNETFEQCLHRELKEELGIEVHV